MANHRFTLSIEVPAKHDLMNNHELASYILDAVGAWWGQAPPEDPWNETMRWAKTKVLFRHHGETLYIEQSGYSRERSDKIKLALAAKAIAEENDDENPQS